jgi:hypothetical protein
MISKRIPRLVPAINPAKPSSWEAYSTNLARMMDYCITNHDLCRDNTSSSGPPGTVLPKQILDVGASGDNLHPHEPYEITSQSNIQYACLNHCWGSKPAFVKQRSTLRQRKLVISWSDLSKARRVSSRTSIRSCAAWILTAPTTTRPSRSGKKLVEKYRLCSLTKESDILSALSGMANSFSNVLLRDEYLAGLWRSGLPLGLLWVSDANCSRRETYLAPSWS